jgi:hypothetical protein
MTTAGNKSNPDAFYLNEMRSFVLFLVVVLAASVVVAREDPTRFDLDIDTVDLTPRDPRTQARLARWNDDPMARVAMHMATEQARMLGGHQPGAGRQNAMVVSMQFKKGLATSLTVSSSASGVELYERRMAVITWPWEKDKKPKPAMPLDEQLTVLLGKRLESQ